MFAVRKRSKNADLAARILALYISRRISFCIPQLLCKGERVFKRHLLIDHFRQNEIRSTVQNACHLNHIIGRQALAHGANDRNTAAHTGLKQEVYILIAGYAQKFCPFCRHKLLIGGDNALPCLQATFNIIIGRMQAAHDFHHDLN